MLTDYIIEQITRRGECRVVVTFRIGEMVDVPFRLTPSDEYGVQSVFDALHVIAKKEIIFRDENVENEQIIAKCNALLAEDLVNTPIEAQSNISDVTAEIRTVDDLIIDKRIIA